MLERVKERIAYKKWFFGHVHEDVDVDDCDLFYSGDIAEEKTLTDFAARVAEKFGKVDYLINNPC